MTFTNQELQIKNIIKTVKNGGLLFVEGNDFFHSFPLTRKETKRILKRKQREIRRRK